ncbi:MAG: DUF3293 domain-containing protein [Gemmatimonadales bacterium]
MRPEEDPGWESYAETVLRWRTNPPITIDLARPVTADTRQALRHAGLGASFGLVTPCNPRGRRADPCADAERMREFLSELDGKGACYLRVDGWSPDGRHVETGVALEWSREEIIALARRWEQSAIYWYDGERFWVLGALTDAAPWPLGTMA